LTLNPGQKLCITGGAGLVGQNLVIKLLQRGYGDITIIDKSSHNLAIARQLHPGVACIEADMADAGPWQETAAQADAVISLHAQIGATSEEPFIRNNVIATRNLLAAMNPAAYLLHVSSSVVESVADDFYTRSKEEQERLVRDSGRGACVLRPTLMFGWFDRKHFGWLSRFMRRSPVFPIPGHGRYLRQPLYAGDFCDIIIACIEQRISDASYNISGKEKVYYRDIIGQIKRATGSWSLILNIPYGLFHRLLALYAMFDRDPPFTTQQLEALVADETFEELDWESIFGVTATPLEQAIRQAYTDPVYSKIRLKF
jgi:nucleoside-diphosphate-sugar epimerase